MKTKKMSKELEADLRDLFGATKPEQIKRFKTPDWYLDPKKVKAIRLKLNASQSQFARSLHISVKTVQYWEQVSGAIGLPSTMLRLLDEHPRLYGELNYQHTR
jgi:DNA-binding transcriptional regulator YiaG